MAKNKFRYGDYRLESLENRTEPAESMGYTITRVSDAFSVVNEDTGITKSKEILDLFPHILKALQGAKQGNAVLVKTEKGWIHEKLTDL